MAQIIASSLDEHRGKSSKKNSISTKGSLSALVVVLFVALIILSMIGGGTIAFLSLIGIAVCVTCLFRREVRIDWWIFIPLAVYLVMNLISSWVTHENVMRGYGCLHLIFLTLYAASCSLKTGEANLLRLLCVLWAGVASLLSIIAFTYQAFVMSPTRLEFVVGSPNGLGIFLVLSWFALQSCRMSKLPNTAGATAPGAGTIAAGGRGKLFAVAERFEPIILVALAMTLSMGSVAALLIGIVVLFVSKGRSTTWKDSLRFTAVIGSKVLLSLVIGFLMYMAAERAEAPILCVVILIYLVCMVALWDRFTAFLERNFKVALTLSILGLLCIPLALFMRPSALFTFSERLAMMANGLGYLFVNPLTGVGPMQWQALNLQDADQYFNTNHIHNIYIHVGVEFGLIAMIALIVITVRLFMKHYREAQHGEDAAFLAHLLTDTGFYYIGVVGMFILTAGGSTTPAKKLSSIGSKLLFGTLGLLHFAILWVYIGSF